MSDMPSRDIEKLWSAFKGFEDENGTMSREILTKLFKNLEIDVPVLGKAAGPQIWGDRIKLDELFAWLCNGDADEDSISKPPPPPLPDDLVLKFHSAVRWGKPWPEIVEVLGDASVQSALAAKDPKNGNFALHIASQNGNLTLVTKLIELGANVNVQNGKGQTALHMSVEYDFYFVSKALMAAGAKKEIENGDGNKAITGIDGGKVDKDCWDNPVNILKAATTADEITEAFESLEKAPLESVDKAQLIQTGMMKKKNPATKGHWDHKRFMQLAAKF